jgi:hypothetical protein
MKKKRRFYIKILDEWLQMNVCLSFNPKSFVCDEISTEECCCTHTSYTESLAE